MARQSILRGLKSTARITNHITNANDWDKLLQERMRLGLVSALAVNESLTFNELKDLLQTSDGNLSVHARKLEDAGYILCVKYFAGRIPQTSYQLTPAGRAALESYLDYMESFISTMRLHTG